MWHQALPQQLLPAFLEAALFLGLQWSHPAYWLFPALWQVLDEEWAHLSNSVLVQCSVSLNWLRTRENGNLPPNPASPSSHTQGPHIPQSLPPCPTPSAQRPLVVTGAHCCSSRIPAHLHEPSAPARQAASTCSVTPPQRHLFSLGFSHPQPRLLLTSSPGAPHLQLQNHALTPQSLTVSPGDYVAPAQDGLALLPTPLAGCPEGLSGLGCGWLCNP